MVSSSKLYFTLRKKFIACIVLRIEKARSHRMTLGNRGNTHGFQEFQFHDFSPSNKFKTLILTLQLSVHLPYIRQHYSKHEQNDEIRHSSFRSSRPHEVKSTDMRCILTTNINISRGENTTRRKKCQIFASVMYSCYQAGVSPEGGLEVGQTL